MCGVVGIWQPGHAPEPVTTERLRLMTDRIAHRGPDGNGHWVSPDGRIGLGHRRLAILDLSDAAAQPMGNADGSIQISFNGEIYNHRELRAELTALGHVWRTDHADTEVLLHAYEAWGIACLQRLRGMFAFALWDGRDRSFWVVRDRLGIKPLYYADVDGGLTVASEIKALLADPRLKARVDETALFHYLTFCAVPAPLTMVAGVRKLAAGTWLRLDADGHRTEGRYWDVWDQVSPLHGASEGTLVAAIREQLEDAVTCHKESDVPVGVFLSGGIDSGTNAALFSHGEQRPVQTFSIGYAGSRMGDELDAAAEMARFVGAEHHDCRIGEQDVIDLLPELVYHMDEPLPDPVCTPLYLLAKLARRHGVTVCQLGEGADELFWGYPQWLDYLQMDRQLHRLPGLLGHGARLGLAMAGRREGWTYERLGRTLAGQPTFWGGLENLTHPQKQRLLAPDVARRLQDVHAWDGIAGIWQRFQERAWTQHPSAWMSYLDLNLRLPELLLMRCDKMAMAVGLEGRVPYLDHHLVELAMSLPVEARIGGPTLKPLLKKAVRGLIPDPVLDRPKQGFALPIAEWLNGRLGAWANQTIADFCRDSGLVDGPAVTVLIAERPAERTWLFLSLALWWRRFCA